MIRRPPRSTPLYSSAASDVYKRQVRDPVREVAVEVRQEPGDVGHEGMRVLIGGHGRHLARLDLRGEEPQGVGALDGAADTVLGDHLEHPRLRQEGDVAIHAPRWHVALLTKAG